MPEANQLLYWAECWAGPADGDVIPINTDDPMPIFPYLDSESGDVSWYQLYANGAGGYRFVLRGATIAAPWTAADDD